MLTNKNLLDFYFIVKNTGSFINVSSNAFYLSFLIPWIYTDHFLFLSVNDVPHVQRSACITTKCKWLQDFVQKGGGAVWLI